MVSVDHHTLEKVAKVLIKDMFQISPGETVAITIDSGSHMDISQALFKEVSASGGLPMLIEVPLARGDSEVGMPDWPSVPLTAALSEVDVWIEMNAIVLLYSSIWERAMSSNKKLRYLILGNSSAKSLERILTGYSISALSNLLQSVVDLVRKAKEIRITSRNGTDVSYLTDDNHALDIDDGDYSKPIFGTAPGYVNIVPKVGSMNGRIVFDELQYTDIYETGKHIEFIMKDGAIDEVLGGAKARHFETYLSSFDDPNMYKISHHMIGLNPGVRTLVGEIVEDERIWGGVDFGFGHTSPIDMPPHGQIAKSHFDGIIKETSIYFDDEKIVEDGIVCHPELVAFASQLLMTAAS